MPITFYNGYDFNLNCCNIWLCFLKIAYVLTVLSDCNTWACFHKLLVLRFHLPGKLHLARCYPSICISCISVALLEYSVSFIVIIMVYDSTVIHSSNVFTLCLSPCRPECYSEKTWKSRLATNPWIFSTEDWLQNMSRYHSNKYAQVQRNGKSTWMGQRSSDRSWE